MKLSRIVGAIGLAVGAQAALAAGGALDLSSGSTGFSDTPAAGGFLDLYTFTLSTASVLTGSLTSVVSGAQDIDFSAVFLTGPSGVFSFTQLLGDPFETWGLSATTLAAGSYSLAVIGTNSAAIASYGGNLAVTPVPEPEPVALLLAGLGVVALLNRRRSGAPAR